MVSITGISTYPEFKNVREDFLNIGKISILAHILGYEGALKGRDGNNLRSDSWLNGLCKFIDDKDLLEESASEHTSIKIITFNYDRNIEHYLYNYDKFKNRRDKVKLFIERSLVHFYGKIGELEWQDKNNFLENGEPNNNPEKLFNNRESIRLIFDDRVQNKINSDKAFSFTHKMETQCICVFGFNFDFINCRLLWPSQNFGFAQADMRMIANIYPYDDVNFIDRRFMANRIRNFKPTAELTYFSCSDFLNYIFYEKNFI